MTGITYQTTAEDVASKAMQVTVAVERLETTEKQAVREYARQARLPGFRKGHAPEPVVRKRFETEIRRYILEHALRESWETILKETELKPVADPQVRNVKFEVGQPLTFELHVDVRPQLTLATTGGFSLSRTVQPVTDEMVTEQIDRIREQRGAWSPLDNVQPKPGNLVSITVTTIEAGKEPVPGQPHDLVLGSGQTIPDLEERIMAMRPGETIDTDVRFPDDHPDEARRGEVRKVRVSLHEVKEQVLPALDDAFAKEAGDFETVAALKTAVRTDLEAEAARRADAGVREELIGKLAEANQVPAPASMVHRLVHAYAESYEVPKGQFEAFEASFRPVAEQQVRRELVLEAVATAQKLHASEGDIDARVAKLAEARGVETGKLYTSLQQANRLGELERAITEEKTFAWLLEQSTVTEVAA